MESRVFCFISPSADFSLFIHCINRDDVCGRFEI